MPEIVSLPPKKKIFVAYGRNNYNCCSQVSENMFYPIQNRKMSLCQCNRSLLLSQSERGVNAMASCHFFSGMKPSKLQVKATA